MSNLLDLLQKIFTPVKPLSAGMYHYIAPPEDPRNYRLHLRLEPDGRGILIVNASTVLHLNQTATEYAYHLIHGTPENQVANTISSRYRVSRSKALDDYCNFFERIETLISTPDLDPVTFLYFDRQEPYSGQITAPYRLDCALTYRLPQGIDSGLAPTRRVARELTTQEWSSVLDKAWQFGIPHVIFTGGEPTLRDDLIDLINKAEENGQVTGLLTDGLRFFDKEFLDAILQTGLDHLLIAFHPEADTAWHALKNMLDEDIYTAVHLTITPNNANNILGIIRQLSDISVEAISLSTTSKDLENVLDEARQLAADLKIDLVWNIPVPYSQSNPVILEVEAEGEEVLEGAGRAWLYIEPDGDVLPAQGVNQVLGNILTDTLEDIFSSSK